MKHMVIPDVQAKPGQDFTFLRHIGQYMVDKRPDVVIQIGDFADMESLSSYDKGKKSFEGRRFTKDIEAATEAMDALMGPIRYYNMRAKETKHGLYRPRLILTLGNHEERINRAINDDPMIDGLISTSLLPYAEWEVYPYLDVAQVDGVCYSHFFTSGVMGRPVGTARLLLQKKHQSCVQGHVQKMDIATDYRADGSSITGLFSGCCYEHNEDYLGAQGNNYFRGIHMLYDVDNGSFHTHSITLKYLRDKYGMARPKTATT